jgi:hypothetical protein
VGAVRPAAGGVALYLRVTPNARQDAIGGVWRGASGEERLALRVAAPPDKGRANAAVVRLLADALDLPKSRIEITAGATDRLKTAAIVGDPAALAARIEALMTNSTKDPA